MSVHEIRTFEILCDHKGRNGRGDCRECFEDGNACVQSEIERSAEREGWLIAGDECFCPGHANSKQSLEAQKAS